MKSLPRVQGEKIQIELLGMHKKCPFSIHDEYSTEDGDDQDEASLRDASEVSREVSGDEDVSIAIGEVPGTISRVTRTKTDTNGHKTTNKSTADLLKSSHPQKQQQQQQQNSSSGAEVFTSFLLGAFSMTYQELVVLPQMIQKMKESGTLDYFEKYLRSGHSNAQQVLKDALQGYRNSA